MMRLLSALIFITPTLAGIGPQMKDYLCGCEYCVTVNPHEPLDIAGHMIRCHTQREGMMKTMEIMRQSKQPEVVVPEKDEPVYAHDEFSWKETELYGWVFMEKEQTTINNDQWIFLDGIDWTWAPAGLDNYLYSYTFGWLYNRIYKQRRVIYWYDRRMWVLPRELIK